jgi:hypothetical protein
VLGIAISGGTGTNAGASAVAIEGSTGAWVGGITDWIADCTEVATSAAAAAVDVTIDCVRSPVSPGLPTRTEMAMLHDVQMVIPATSSGGGGSAQAQCQFRTIVVAPAGGVGTAGTPSPASQFQNQFQMKVCDV